ncbi:MAG: phage Gp37/Gp68 family protein [Rubrivivax sp.]|nr:phage Gp37/Gp68 family protein [Rubrivivax sp.]
MSATTGIQWTDATFNPWAGCTKVSPGCDNCYAEKSPGTVLRGIRWGAGAPRMLSKDWTLPQVLQRRAERTGTRPRLFCASLADVFDNEVPDEWHARLFELIERTPLVTWQLLTKRIGNVRRAMPANVWLGATCVTQDEIERDLPKLRRSAAAVRFVSIEPQIERIDLRGRLDGIHWVINGGESGGKHRPFDLAWARQLRDQCEQAGVPFFFKQIGARTPGDEDIPEDLRIRQFPPGAEA